uniref:DUF3631 domain-containing protein n=1 Tax=Pseudonocardia sp. ICBG1142 TaxID=2846760 RepID=UPI001CF60AF0
LGKLLAEYDIQSRKSPPRLRPDSGYQRAAFADAWRRYTPDLITDGNNSNDRRLSHRCSWSTS